jgi:NADH-quinone oxidoreductase subunit L
VACLAIAGLPPLAGFFSKEEILMAAYKSNRMIFVIAMFTSLLTAFYMFRLYFNIFWGGASKAHSHEGKEGNFALLLPLALLSIGAMFAGFIPFGKFVTSDGLPLATQLHLDFSIAPVALGLLGIGLAWVMYRKPSAMPDRVARMLGPLYETAKNKFYIDELYLFVTQKVLFNLVGRPAAWIDKNIVDGLVNLTGNSTLKTSEAIRGMQSGKVQQYAMYFLVGLILLVIGWIYL